MPKLLNVAGKPCINSASLFLIELVRDWSKNKEIPISKADEN
jgi:hypothetical protein